MGLKALYVIEVKTRLIEIGKEIDALAKMVETTGSEGQTFFGPQIEAMRARHKELQDDHDLLRLFDESEWGGFADTMDRAVRKLAHDVSVLQAEVEAPLVPA